MSRMKGSCFLLHIFSSSSFYFTPYIFYQIPAIKLYLCIVCVRKVQNLFINSELKFFAKYCLLNGLVQSYGGKV